LGGRQVDAQVPSEQTSLVSHAFGHVPQWSRDVDRSTSQPFAGL
jgi:hypothetical protein